MSSGLTPWLLSGILSRPWWPLASLPPEVDVPLPLGLGFIELPVVGDVPGVAELAAGSPVVEPRPLGPPVCAFAQVAPTSSATANAADAKDIKDIVVSFMAIPFGCP